MDVRLATLSSELVKIAAENEKRRSGILGATVAALPFTAATAAADIPRGWVDKSIEQTIRGVSKGRRESSLLRGVGRGAGRFGAGLITSPVFVSGLNDLRSGDEHRRKKGYAKVVGSGLVFSAIKGGGEAAVENARKNPMEILRKVRSTVGARGVVGVGAAALTARAVASATSTKKGDKPKGTYKSYIAPTLAGGAIGAGKGAFDEVWVAGRKTSLRGLTAKAGGRAAAGLIGAAVLTGAVKTLLPSKKNPHVRRWQKTKTADVGGRSDIYDGVSKWAKSKSDEEVYEEYKLANSGGIGERSPSRRAAFYALHDELQGRGHVMPRPVKRARTVANLAPGSARDRGKELVRLNSLSASGASVAVVAAPAIGMSIISALPPTDRDRVLSDALDRLIIRNGLTRYDMDSSASIFGEGPHYSADIDDFGNPMNKSVTLPKAGKGLPGVAAHEVGHSTAGKFRHMLMGRTARMAHGVGAVMSVVIPILATESAGDGSYATREDLESRAKLLTAIGVVTGSMQAPVLAEETLANIKAVGVLRRAGATLPESLAKLLTHAGAGYATYAAPVALPFLVAAGLKAKSSLGRRKE